MAILTELKDPRIQGVTVTYVEVSDDLRYAKVHVSIMGEEPQQRLSMKGLSHAAGFLQAKVAKRLELRYTPRLSFILDMGVKRSIEVARILREVLPPSDSGPGPSVSAADRSESAAADECPAPDDEQPG